MNFDYPQDRPIGSLPGIGRKRTAVLSRLGIHTINQFIERTVKISERSEISQELNISERMVLDFRQKAINLSGNEHQHKSKFIAVFVFALLTIGLGIILILGGTVIHSFIFKESRFPTFVLQLLENDKVDAKAFGWMIEGESILRESGVTHSRVKFKPDFRDGISSQFPESIPEGLFIPWLTKHTVLRSALAEIQIVELGTQTVEGQWIKEVVLNKKQIYIPTRVDNVSHLENFPGINFIVHFDRNVVPRKLSNRQRVQFSLEVEFEDTGFGNLLNRYTSGLISIHLFLSASEQRVLGIKKKKWGKIELPGKFINLEENLNRIGHVEYIWRSELSGEFESPDDLIGAKQYSGDGEHRVKPRFPFLKSIYIL